MARDYLLLAADTDKITDRLTVLYFHSILALLYSPLETCVV